MDGIASPFIGGPERCPNHGNHDKWLIAKPSGRKEYASMPLTMQHAPREDLPFYYALADAFTVCDQHFCSSLTGTTPTAFISGRGPSGKSRPRIPRPMYEIQMSTMVPGYTGLLSGAPGGSVDIVEDLPKRSEHREWIRQR